MPTNRFPFAALVAVVVATFLSGAAALAYEVSWSRMLVVPLGNSSDATALVLASFMLGIALGARALGGLADRVHAPLKLYAAVEILLGADPVRTCIVGDSIIPNAVNLHNGDRQVIRTHGDKEIV